MGRRLRQDPGRTGGDLQSGAARHDLEATQGVWSRRWTAPALSIRPAHGGPTPRDPDRSLAQWRWTRGYVEDVAHAISLAASDERASGQVYNLGEADTMTEGEWIRLIGKVLGWKGQVVEAMPSQLPDHLKFPYDISHSLLVDTTKIRQELEFREMVSKEESIWRTADWELANEPGPVEALQEEYKAEDRAWDIINRQ